MATPYAGPLRDEPLAIEFHNTRYATAAGAVDAFADPGQLAAWLAALAPRLADLEGVPGPAPTAAALGPLRDAVTTLLHAALAGAPLDRAALRVVNAASGAAPRSPRADLCPDGTAVCATDHHGADRATATLAAFARDAIGLLTGPGREELRACEAPGCILLFLKDHPRRAWCSAACGNRARQARHYRRSRGRA